MRLKVLSAVLLSGSMMAGLAPLALAADPGMDSLPAVSAVNGKIELGGGYADIDTIDEHGLFHGGASLSIPLGHDFGLQADVAAAHMFDDTMFGGNLHLFTRDPDSYLFGIVGGAGFSDNVNIAFIGPEIELYANSFSVEGWAGYLNVDPDGAASSDEFFAQVDLGFYATDNFRLTVGVSSIAEFESVHAGLEWQLSDFELPLSLTANAEFGEDDFVAVSAGLKLYFGEDGSKSLIRRHREDDPRNRSLDIFAGAGNAFTPGNPPPPPDVCDPEFEECPD